ncbi:asparagine synthase C-terminal domain-containing protein [Rhodococcus sp. H36-A4]|uniref:asparagine synthase C-terminal domain-containing protein n=1 Tax=Rhodococcus sp. H36-A4 TaxID=3004353 RepID=UPI0022AFC9F3|nr:asparagine synthase C-terminal domain-containing protein [Rhodococcus sp. H36-A4]MCZ4080500.1 asparagine synthase C-terminal domain-containing protein [Rhodococcus sp. H36-A4]
MQSKPPESLSSTRAHKRCSLDQAMGWLDDGLRTAATEIAAKRRPLRLLLSGGVDSALLASYLWNADADIRALTFRTPWGDEVEGASRTAHHVGLPLDVVDVTAEELTAAISPCMRYTQSDDADVIVVHLLITVAFEIARVCGADLITGLGSDLLNAGGTFGMNGVADDPFERVDTTSASGLMATDQFSPGPRMYHPYWSSPLIQLQQDVPAQLKTTNGIEKYYLRQLAAHQLPVETAFGKKVAIQEGSGLIAGLEGALGEPPSTVCARIRADALAGAVAYDRNARRAEEVTI